jgi:hypothetical protein
MLSVKNVIILGTVAVIFIILQAVLILSSVKLNDPADVAVDFTKAYFMLDGTSMTENLCREISEDEGADIVGGYLFHTAEQAKAMGFSPGYMKNQLAGVHTETNIMDQTNAKVRVTGERLRSINPIFAFVGRLFFLIETHKFDETLTLVKEEGKWRVCGRPFLLSEI